jgi:hypothetical protein
MLGILGQSGGEGLVPRDYAHPSVPVPVDRHSRRSTFTAGIAVDGFRAKPFVIVPRVTVENELELSGYDQTNGYIAFLENTFVTSHLFELSGTEAFFPLIVQWRNERDDHGKVILLINGLGSHHTDRLRE